MKLKKQKAFTLVELIIVITILAILATIAFVSFQGYVKDSRDSTRLTTLKNIESGLQTFQLKTGNYPEISKGVDIFASGILIGKQGAFGTIESNLVGLITYPVDMESGKPYTYFTNTKKSKYQLLGFLESQNTISLLTQKTFAGINNSFPKVLGDSLGILLDESNTPVQDLSLTGIDIVTTSKVYKALISNSYILSGSGKDLSILLGTINAGGIQSSCKAYLNYSNTLKNQNGMYLIYSTNNQIYKTYCDMENDEGGWSLLFSVDPAGVTWKSDSSMWTGTVYTNSQNLNFTSDIIDKEIATYAYGDMKGNEVKICRGSNMKNCYIMKHNLNRTLKSFYDVGDSYVDFSRCDKTYIGCQNGQLPSDVGIDRKLDFFSKLGFSEYSSFPKYGVGININPYNKLGFQGDNNNSWPTFDNDGVGIGVSRVRDCLYSNFADHPNGYTDYTRMRSISTYGTCEYILPDTNFWYVYIR